MQFDARISLKVAYDDMNDLHVRSVLCHSSLNTPPIVAGVVTLDWPDHNVTRIVIGCSSLSTQLAYILAIAGWGGGLLNILMI